MRKSTRKGVSKRENLKGLGLTPLEERVYQLLHLHEGNIISRETLLRDVWGFQNPVDTRSIDMCVGRLRSKIGPNRIVTVYGKGYMMPVGRA